MNFDQLGPSWRTENEAVVSAAPTEEKRLERYVTTTRATERFWSKILRRDLIETAACLFVIYSFGRSLLGAFDGFALPRVAATGMVVNIAAAVFVMWRLYRTRTSTPAPRLDVPMREYCENEIKRVDKQIAMLRSVHVWYLAPFYLGVTLFFFAIDGLCTEFVGITFLVTVMYAFIFALNRSVASTSMTDLRNDLVALRDSLTTESAPGRAAADPPDRTKETWRFVISWILILLASVAGMALFGWIVDVEYPKRSPFDGIRWREETPEVRLEDDWYELVSIDSVATADILSFCKWNYFAKWRMRFEEDLVEVLTQMGHEPGDTVRLVVSPLDSDDELVLNEMPMSEAKRWAIKAAAMSRGREEPPANENDPNRRQDPSAAAEPSRLPTQPGDETMRTTATLLSGLLLTNAAVAVTPEQIDRLAKPYVDSETVVGMTVGVLQGDEATVRGYGHFSESDSRVPDGATIYEIGSVSKVFTGLLLADAIAMGRVSPVTPVDELLPASIKMPRREKTLPIRLWHLATHTSGLPRLPTNLEPSDPNNPYADYDGKRLAAFLREYQPLKRPGEKMAYSNFGAGLLGELLAQEQETTYESLLESRVAEPLGLADTTIQLTDDQKARLAPPHLVGGAPGHNWDLGKLAGAGAIRSTVDDLMKFAAAQLDPPEGKLGQAIDFAWMIHQKPIADTDFAMGFGWHVARDGSTRWHNGETGGYHSAVFVSRDLNAAVVVLTNTATGEIDQLAEQIIQSAAGMPVEPRVFPEKAEVAPEVMQRYVGKYAITPAFVLTVSIEGGKLMVGATGQSTYPLAPESETLWRHQAVDAKLEFHVDKAGNCSSVDLLQNGMRQKAKRID
ncbi:Beta-lactamase precursor [Botrimarina colliarenosi]|uniref:Beta-lactamase n=1 Tax=Botrimarina colliarenosi TaxID=2528001 RepID=A0A5C6AJ95_9BACT|nr:serine hydrolase [Botrimarina colliarenosi]TWU00095.1 Beta-lactamase precursor [Botrimarina colliarenosi]